MNQLAQLLEGYAEHHQQFGVPFEKKPPVSASEVAEAEAILGALIPASVLELWRWSNGAGLAEGAEVSGEPPFFLNGMRFLPLKTAAELTTLFATKQKFSDDPGENAAFVDQFEPYPSLMVGDAYETLEAVVSLRESDLGSVWLWMDYGRACRRCFDSIEEFVQLQISFYGAGAVTEPPYPTPDLGYPEPLALPGNRGFESVDVPMPWYATWYERAWDEGWTVPAPPSQ